jgi:hypothetical protein
MKNRPISARILSLLSAGALLGMSLAACVGAEEAEPLDPVDTEALDVGTGPANCTSPYRSCLEILNAWTGVPNPPSGIYTIDIDTNGPLSCFQVYCDMERDGGGWTGITRPISTLRLGGATTVWEGDVDLSYPVDGGPACTRDGSGSHTAWFDFMFPAGFEELYLSDYIAESHAGPGDTSDLGYTQLKWTDATGSFKGDISFGSGADEGPLSGAHFSSHYNGSYPAEKRLLFPSEEIFALGATQTVFRIGWGEAGSEHEGWCPWMAGTIFLR